MSTNSINIKSLLLQILAADKKFFILITSYAIVIAIINLALPISIQMLINNIAYTALIQPIIIVSIVLVFLLCFSAILSLMQTYLLEIYKRNSFVRIGADFFTRSIYSEHPLSDKNNTSDLSGRFFEIFNIQGAASTLIVEGLLVILQIIVSFTLSSFYHPYLLGMNIFAGVVIYFTWSIFKQGAIDSAIKRCNAKFKVFDWLNEVFRMNTYFKSTDNKQYALHKAKWLMNEYVESRKEYWNISFKQLIILTILYAIFTITLFSLGSILVIKGQLSLGQLVAAEIIFASTLVGISKLSYYFDIYYNLVASADEINYVYENPKFTQEVCAQGNQQISNHEITIKFEDVIYFNKDISPDKYHFNFEIKPCSINLMVVKDCVHADIIRDLINQLIYPISGQITINNHLQYDFNPQDIRNHICVIDGVDIFSGTIYEYLSHGKELASHTDINNALIQIGLNKAISELPNKSDTLLINNGYPLHPSQVIQLKLARAIIHKPKAIIINELSTNITPDICNKLFLNLKEHAQTSILYISVHSDATKLLCDQVIDLT